MLTKLAFKNVGKSFKDYAVYFFTLVLGVSIFYMFNSIYAQKELMVVTETTNQAMVALREILSYISVFVAVVLGFLIVYANNFFIKRRKKELGLYMLLGITKRKISTILVLETSLLAIVALVVGLVLGVAGSQFMSVFTAKIFEADMTSFKFVFSRDAVVKSILYFGIIFLIVMVFNTFTMNRLKLIDLLYAKRKNERLKVQKNWVSVSLFITSITALAGAYGLILWNGLIYINKWFLLSLLLGTVGTVLFFLSLSAILIKVIRNNKKIYYKDLNLFVIRQLSSKVNTNFISMSVICIMILLVIGIFSTGYSLQNVVSNELRESVPYDFSVYDYSREDLEPSSIFDRLPDDIKNIENMSYTETYEYITSEDALKFEDLNLDLTEAPYITNLPITFMSVSDFNKALALQDKEPISLAKDTYGIVISNDSLELIGKAISSKRIELSIDDKILRPVETIYKEKVSNSALPILFIVNDHVTETMLKDSITLNIQCGTEETAKVLNNKLDRTWRTGKIFAYYNFKMDLYANSVTTKAMLSFLAIYLGSVFIITCAAILAIQQLSEIEEHKERYELLKKLGVQRSMLNRALFIQILCYFLFPLILAVIHSIVGLNAANDVIRTFGKVHITSSIIATSLFILSIYGTYFYLTYLGSKRIINKY